MSNAGARLERFLVETFQEITKVEEAQLAGRVPGLSLREFHLIEAVCRAQDQGLDNRSTAIAAAQGVTAGTLTTMVSQLERKGYLERRRDQRDHRAIHLLPTAIGRLANGYHTRFHQELVGWVLAALTEEQAEVFADGVEQVAAFLRGAPQQRQSLRQQRGFTKSNSEERITMSKIVLMTDSASDITAENEAAYNIRIICIKHAFGEKSYVSRVDFNNETYYQMLDEFPGIPTTTQVTPFEFEEIFNEEYGKGCEDLIYVALNAKGSATHGNALAARETFYDEHPEAREKMRIHIIDGRTYTGAYGYAVVEGAKMLQAGESVDRTVEFITDWCSHCEIYFVPYTLKYAAKSGRINGAAAFLGNTLGIKPLMLIQNGEINDVAKIRGEKNVVKTIMEHALPRMKPQTPYLIVYGSDRTVGEAMAQAMTEHLGYPPADLYQIGAEIAANAGPKVVGVMFYHESN